MTYIFRTRGQTIVRAANNAQEKSQRVAIRTNDFMRSVVSAHGAIKYGRGGYRKMDSRKIQPQNRTSRPSYTLRFVRFGRIRNVRADDARNRPYVRKRLIMARFERDVM